MDRRLLLVLLLGLGFASQVGAIDKARLRWARSKPAIDSIHIDGNAYFSDPEIKKQLYSRPRNIWLAIKGDRRSKVQRETRQRDTLEIKYLYLTNGFFGVKVHHTYEPLGQDSSALVRIAIEEGRQYRYGAKSLRGDYDSTYHVTLRNMIDRLATGEPVNPFELRDVEIRLRTYLANRGYPYARVAYAVDTTGALATSDVVYEVVSDSLVRFGDVRVEVTNPKRDGSWRYPEKASTRELKIAPDAVYRRDDIIESQRRLFESGYFTTFQLKDTVRINRLRPDFVLRLTERKSTFIAFRVGAGQSEVRDLVWDVSAGGGTRKFLGTRTLDGSGDLSFSAGSDTRLLDARLRARYIEPWFLGTRTKATLTAEVQPWLKDPVKDFDKRSWSVSAGLSKWYGRRLRAHIGVEYENVNLAGIPEDEIPIVKEQEGISARRKLYFSIRRDSRNDLFIPWRGSLTELSVDFYGGFMKGDADFFKIQGSWSRYRLTWPGWIAATRIRGEWAQEFGQTPAVPVDEALYLGGANTVRGFKENMLGPLDADGEPEGARYTLVFNQEFRWKTVQILNALPLIGDLFKRFPQWQSLFVDIGNGFRNKEEMTWRNMAVAYGTGFQITSPAGPIRIDRAWVYEHHDFEYSDRWHFTILYAF
jgi:outer membrane protein assembly complex protein YaeT